MLGHVLAAAQALEPRQGRGGRRPRHGRGARQDAGADRAAQVFVQHERKGTADALLAARPALETHTGDVLVLFADTPLARRGDAQAAHGRASTTAPASRCSASRRPIPPATAVSSSRAAAGCPPSARTRMRARRSAASACATRASWRSASTISLGVLGRIGNSNAKGEYYLTDAVEIARADGTRAAAVACAEDEVMGINSREQLAAAEAVFQKRARMAAMREGATLIAPETVWLAFDTDDRPRRHDRAQRVLRPRRDRRGRRRDHGQLPHRGRAHRRRARASVRSRGCGREPTSAHARTSATSSR